MKTKTQTLTMIAAIFFAAMIFTFSNGCKKETGPAGPAGTNGTNGTNGNANVISSSTFALNNWVDLTNDGTNFQCSNAISWSAISQDIKDKGIVMVYLQDNSNLEWIALPYSSSFSLGGGYGSVFYSFGINVGLIKIYATGFADAGSLSSSDFNSYNFIVRAVAIPSSSRMAHPEVDLNNYEEVKKVFNLKD